MCFICKPPSFSKKKFFDITCSALDAYGKTYDNVVLMGDFNTMDKDEVLLEPKHNRLDNYK